MPIKYVIASCSQINHSQGLRKYTLCVGRHTCIGRHTSTKGHACATPSLNSRRLLRQRTQEWSLARTRISRSILSPPVLYRFHCATATQNLKLTKCTVRFCMLWQAIPTVRLQDPACFGMPCCADCRIVTVHPCLYWPIFFHTSTNLGASCEPDLTHRTFVVAPFHQALALDGWNTLGTGRGASNCWGTKKNRGGGIPRVPLMDPPMPLIY